MQKFLFTLCVTFWFALPVHADQGEDFVAARDAYVVGNIARLDVYAKRLQGYVLEPYVAYWQLRARLDDATPETVRAFMWRYGDTLLADRLRAEWLKALAKKQEWSLFSAEFPLLLDESVELTCYALQGRMHNNDETALLEARALWFSAQTQPDSCYPLFETMFTRKVLGPEDVWQRLRLALEAGDITAAKRIVQYLPAKEAPNPRLIKSITDRPERYLSRPDYDLKTRVGRELRLFALYRQARNEPQQAAAYLKKLHDQLNEQERNYAWAEIALNASLKHDPDALSWYGEVPPDLLNVQQLAWKARAALLAQNWGAMLASIDALSPLERRESNWRYWKARALKALGKNIEADAIFQSLSSEHHYYGQLAGEELGNEYRPPVIAYRPSEAELSAMQQLPGIQRALALYRLDLRYEGNLEWQWSIRNFDDRQLLAAAEVARRNELYERAIFTANRTVQLHDFSMRYLAPYRELMQEYVNQSNLDEAWLYGIIRQESRFTVTARSNAGASGLMQLMPATAKWVATRIGHKGYRQSRVNDLDTNLNLGTHYLKHMLDLSGGQLVLATAAYNAGPTRARQWGMDVPMEGAIYVESIPLNETRDYVKKVLSNTLYYASAFGKETPSLKALLGTIPPRSQNQTLRDER
ncbi:MAG: transglycosylase SLT domain-containing protein [Burkholderiales bacterium]